MTREAPPLVVQVPAGRGRVVRTDGERGAVGGVPDEHRRRDHQPWPLPGTASERREPTTEAGTPNAEVHEHDAARGSGARGGSAAIPRSTTAGSTAASSRSPGARSRRARGSPGVDTTAPPMPNMPDSTPVTNADEQRQCELRAQRARPRRLVVRRNRPAAMRDRRVRLRRMTSDLDLRGVWVPLITPFDADGRGRHRGDRATLRRVPRRRCRPASSRSARRVRRSALDADEKRAVDRRVSRASAPRARQPLIVGTGTNNTARHDRRNRRARRVPGRRRRAGGRARTTCGRRKRRSSSTTGPSRQASPVPVVAYNIPIAYGSRPRARARCSTWPRSPNIAGVKQAVGTLDADTLEVLADGAGGLRGARRRGHAAVPDGLCMGAVGAISAAAHCAPRGSSR